MADLALSIAALIGASPCIAQTSVTSLEELRSTLASGDDVVVVTAAGIPVAGRLRRLGDADLDVYVAASPRDRGQRKVTIPLDAIQSLERRPDSVRNGAVTGAASGAGFGGAMFAYAVVIDRNEMDEWAPIYVGAAAACTAVGALIGWMIDAAHSKPHIRFEPSTGRTRVGVHPVSSGRRAIAVAVSISR
jgi:hypothetical protein